MAGKANQWQKVKKARLLLAIFLIGFLLNLLRENVQAPLYEGYSSFRANSWIAFGQFIGWHCNPLAVWLVSSLVR